MAHFAHRRIAAEGVSPPPTTRRSITSPGGYVTSTPSSNHSSTTARNDSSRAASFANTSRSSDTKESDAFISSKAGKLVLFPEVFVNTDKICKSGYPHFGHGCIS